jgi:formate dehydrogenase maturation protein FdhE
MSDPQYHRQHPSESDVLGLVADALVFLERDVRDAGPAEAIRAEVARVSSGAATLVVVGEKKRGKSSLINALIGCPGLLPVEVDVATGVHLVVRHADKPGARAFLDGDAAGQEIDLAEIAEYAALDPVSQVAHRSDVHHVEVGVPSPLLAAGLILVDTPGVGGLTSGHARITMAALNRADALVFVVNGQTELTASELRFLVQATERIAEVVFVLTQTDKYGDWRTVLEKNRRLLAEHAPRYASAPWFAVSSRAKEDADTAARAGRDEAAARLLERSGFASLEAALTTRIAERSAELRLANCVHVVLSVLAPIATVDQRRLRSLAQDPTLKADVQSRREALHRLQGQDAAWRKQLAKSSRDLERRLRLGFQRNVNDLRGLVDEKVATSSAKVLAAELPRDLEAAVEAIWLDLDGAARQGMTDIVAEVERECRLEVGAEMVAELTVTRPERLTALPTLVATAPDNRGFLGFMERFMPARGAGIVTAAVVSAFTGSVMIPLAAGFGMAALLSGRRKRRTDLMRVRGDAQRYTGRLIAELTTEIPPQITATVEEMSDLMAKQITALITEQRGYLEAELAYLQQNLDTAAEKLAQQREQLQLRLAELNGIIGRGREAASLLASPGEVPAG